jgi:hypothetical protein
MFRSEVSNMALLIITGFCFAVSILSSLRQVYRAKENALVILLGLAISFGGYYFTYLLGAR